MKEFRVYMFGSWIISVQADDEQEAEDKAFRAMQNVHDGSSHPIYFRRIDEVIVE